jgi:hypothetical protein
MTKVYDTATDLITFARSSSGTALRRVGYGENLVENDDFATDTDWTKGTGWTISGGVATLDGSQVSVSDFSQALTLKANTIYQVSLDVTNVTTALDLVTITSTGGPELQDLSDTGTYTAVFVAPSTSEQLIIRGTSSSVATIDNISVKEVFLDRATDPLVLFNHPDDIPRIEYGSDGSLKGLLIEEQRTNLITHSEATQTNWPAYGASTVTDLSEDALGVFPGISVASGGQTWHASSPASISLTASEVYCLTIWYAAGTSNELYVAVKDVTTADEVRAKGVIGSLATSGQAGSMSILSDEGLSGGVRRLSVTVTPSNTGAHDLIVGPNSATSGQTVKVYGAQLEAGSFATSYIPTSGSTVTRSPDIASIPVSAFGYNQEAGTVVVDYSMMTGVFSASPYIVQFDDGTEANRILLMELSNKSRFFMNVSGITQETLVNETISEGVLNRSAAAFTENDTAMSTNGSVAEAGDGTSTVPGGITTVRLSGNTSNNNSLNGHIKSLKYYPRRLTDAQLQELTA